MKKPLVFISHINSEKEIAQTLKKLVQSTFLNMIDVFVSSDPTSIKLGRKWLDEITYALKHCAVEIILASPESIKRPWINFEGGAGWVRDIAVIPLCHSGMLPAQLPAPLSSLQAATATKEAELKLIFPVLADAVGCQLPEINFAEFISVVEEYEKVSNEYEAMTTKTPIAAQNGLSAQELAVLTELAERADAPADFVPLYEVRKTLQGAGYRGVAVVLALNMLGRKDLVETSTETDYNHNEFSVGRITPEGWRWLEMNQHLLALKVEPPNKEADGNTFAEEMPF